VRYAGALGPRSVLRPWLTLAAREKATFEGLLTGWAPPTLLQRAAASARQAGEKVMGRATSAASRAWAACLRRVFEVDPILCRACGLQIQAVAAIVDDRQIERLLTHLGLPTELPKTKTARAPPFPIFLEDSQLDPRVKQWEGVDEFPGELDWASA